MFKRPVFSLAIAIVIAAIVFIFSWKIFPANSEQQLETRNTEIAKSLLQVCVTVVIGGILKMIIDDYQQKQKLIADEKLKRIEQDREKRKTINDLETKLRMLVDDIELARTIITAHGSAKTYGEKMREAVLPAIANLFDLKRSVKKSQIFSDEILSEFRVSIHYMIAYLKALADEYKLQYHKISLKQYSFDCMKEAYNKSITNMLQEKSFKEILETDIEENEKQLATFSENISVQIFNLRIMKDFLPNNNSESKYYKVFLNHFDVCKAILKEQIPDKLNDDFYDQLVKELQEDNAELKNYVKEIMRKYELIS